MHQAARRSLIAVIMAVAMFRDSLMLCEISFVKVECCWSLNQVSRGNAEIVRASVEYHFIHQFAER